jgi:HAD superfamily hydrolase (TIGR01484 family)
MRYLVLAADFDGTIAREGSVAATTVAALERLAATGRTLVLVTGRELDELLAIFPEIGVFHRVVAENGALLYCPATGKRRALGAPPAASFVRELERRGVAPL